MGNHLVSRDVLWDLWHHEAYCFGWAFWGKQLNIYTFTKEIYTLQSTGKYVVDTLLFYLRIFAFYCYWTSNLFGLCHSGMWTNYCSTPRLCKFTLIIEPLSLNIHLQDISQITFCRCISWLYSTLMNSECLFCSLMPWLSNLGLLIYFLQGKFLASFFLGWSITTFSAVCAYPFDTLRRRMMLTSGHPNKYCTAIHAFQEIVRQEGFRALFRGFTANMLLGMAGAGVLAGYDQLNRISSRHSHYNETNQRVLKWMPE